MKILCIPLRKFFKPNTKFATTESIEGILQWKFYDFCRIHGMDNNYLCEKEKMLYILKTCLQENMCDSEFERRMTECHWNLFLKAQFMELIRRLRTNNNMYYNN